MNRVSAFQIRLSSRNSKEKSVVIGILLQLQSVQGLRLIRSR